MEERTLLIGFDLGNEKTQLCYYDENTYEPICIGVQEDENERNMPTVLGLKENGEWVAGQDALDLHRFGECELVENFVNKIANQEAIEVNGQQMTPLVILATYFRCVLNNLKSFSADKVIKKIVVTVEKNSRELYDNIYVALEGVGIHRSSAVVQNYNQSYLYYVLNQKDEFWINDVGMFDFRQSGLKYFQITVDRRRKPYIVGIEERDYSDNLTIDMLSDDKYKENLEYIFENIAQNAIHRKVLSTLYMTGKGFESGWADESMRKLCYGRRVFKGQNLYVKGACYAARKYAGLSKMEDFIFVDEDMIPVHITTNVYVNANNQEVILAKAGSAWYEIDHSINIIPDNENELQINVTNIITRETSKHLLPLDIINPNRPERMSRINVRVRFQSVDKCIVTIKDIGFGELCKTSHRIDERIIKI